MFERLKWHLRRFREAREIQTIGEREFERLPSPQQRAVYLDGWVAWYWNLPPEAWEEAVDLRIEHAELLRNRESAVKAITRKNRLLARYGEDAPEVWPEIVRVEKIKREARKQEDAYRTRWLQFRSVHGSYRDDW